MEQVVLFIVIWLTRLIAIDISACMFVASSSCKSSFFLKKILCLLGESCIVVGCSFLIYFFTENIYDYTFVQYVITAVFVLLNGFVCYKATIRKQIFFIISAFTISLLNDKFFAILRIALEGIAPWLYNGLSVWYHIYWWIIFGITCCVVYILFAKKIRANAEFEITNYNLLAYILFIVLTPILTYFRAVEKTKLIIVNLIEFLYYCLILFIQGAIFHEGEKSIIVARQKAERETIEILWEKGKNQYELQRENLELLNIKYHDLRHQINAAKSSGVLDEKYVEEVETSLGVYGSYVKSGNKALDVVLTEKMLGGIKSHISINYNIDEKALSGISYADIYSLFGNALENAINYLVNVDEDKRFITVEAGINNNFIIIAIENYCTDKIELDEQGLPVTKNNRLYHGYGMKSMQMIAEKYGGSLSVIGENDLFIVQIIIPKL